VTSFPADFLSVRDDRILSGVFGPRGALAGYSSRWPVEQIADGLSGVFGGLLNRYEITWWPPDAPDPGHSARLQIFSRRGCADCVVDPDLPAL
jgi:hypothetical protein